MRGADRNQAKLSYSAHSLMENRNGPLVDFRVAEANGRAEREVALEMLDTALPGQKPMRTTGGRSAIDHRTTRHAGYEVSQRLRKRVEKLMAATG
jgi:hypothetical protein